jgi:alpha-galactosidase
MKRAPLTRRDFILLGAGAAGLRAGIEEARLMSRFYPEFLHPSSPPLSAQGRAATSDELQAADDLIHSFQAASGGWEKRAHTQLFPKLLKPPFSFRYGSKQSSDLLPGWRCESKISEPDADRSLREVSYTDPETGLRVRVAAIQYQDFPGVEWVVYFRNESATETPLLEDIQALDTLWLSPRRDATIHYAKGATCSMDDFMPLVRKLNAGGELRVEPGGGRSSSDFLPFFNLEIENEGAVIAIGWTGEWAMTFSHPEGDHVRLQAGMALTRLRLFPGEEIRTPRILALFWQGERLRGHNLLRRFLLAHHRPRAAGAPLPTPRCDANWGSTPATTHLANIRKIVAHQLPVDYYWIDAEWFGDGAWWRNPGNWSVKKDLYPQGFRPLSDLLHASGLKFLLWFEPERVCEGTPWYTEHANWLLEVPPARRVYNWGQSQEDPRWVKNESLRNQIQENDRLFNLGIPEAREFLEDFISRKIEEFGLDCFRHDANIAPLEFWRAADAPERQGMTEIRWVEGLYGFWDELRRRHPNLLIDVCASGGRRIDLETVGRCIPLTRTDFVRHSTADQCHTYGLLHWAPLNSTLGGASSVTNDYEIRSGMSSGLVVTLFGNGDRAQTRTSYDDFPFEHAKKVLEQQRAIEKFFYGDYYPLTEYSQAKDTWMAYQLDLPEQNEGLVVVLKRPASYYSKAVFPLRALRREVSYEITNLDTAQRAIASGGLLVGEGLEVVLLGRPDSALIHYRAKGVAANLSTTTTA